MRTAAGPAVSIPLPDGRRLVARLPPRQRPSALMLAAFLGAIALVVAIAVTTTFALAWQLMMGPVLRRGALVFLTLPVTLIVASLRPQVFSLLLLLTFSDFATRGWLSASPR